MDARHLNRDENVVRLLARAQLPESGAAGVDTRRINRGKDVMRQLALLSLLVMSCRYMAPAQQSWTPARPYTSTGAKDPGEAPLKANRCGVECGVGFHCDEKTARCVADAVSTSSRDAGAPWLP